MHTISGSTLINADQETVWRALADFGNVYKMSLGVTGSHSTSEQATGEGATRHCDLAQMNAAVEERITRFEPPNAMDIEIYEWRKIPFMRRLWAEFRLEKEGDGTRLTGAFLYELNRNPVGWLMNALMMKRMNRKNWFGFLAGIKHYSETGEEVVRGTRLDFSAVTA